MKKLKYVILLSVVLMCAGFNILRAQQDAMTTQYVVNKLFVNPAYAGYREAPNVLLLQRNQWIGFQGAPRTSVLSFDMPLKKHEFAIGGTMMLDKAGPASKFGLSVDFAYRIRLSNRGTLSFGAKASFEMLQVNLVDLNLISEYYGVMDEAFMNNANGVALPNIGWGVYYFDRTSFLGVSMPKMILNKLERRGTEQYTLLRGRQIPTFNLMAGKVWKINKKMKIQPNFVMRGVWGAPLSVGLYGNVIFLEQLTAGLFCHFGENIGLLGQWQVNKQLKVGYSVDVPTNALIRTGFGSHEILVQYAMATKKKRIVYPRYF